MREVVTDEAYRSSSPLPQAVACNDFVFLSGSAGFDPDTEELVSDDLGPQVDQTFDNIEAVLAEEGLGLEAIVKLTAFLTDPGDFERFNELYRENLPEPYPARTTVVTDLVFDGKVEIEVVAKQ